jgi:hypothetical protein
VGFVMDKVALGQVSSEYFGYLPIFIPSSFHFHSIFIKPYIYIVIIQFILTCPLSCTMIYSDEINQIKSNQTQGEGRQRQVDNEADDMKDWVEDNRINTAEQSKV